MKKILSGIIGVILFGCLIVFADMNIDLSGFKGSERTVFLEENVIGTGKLTEENIKNAKAEGVKTIVDLRSPQEGTGEERVLVQKYGMNYFNVPVTPSSLRKAQADVISHVLSDEANKPVIIHCSSGNRVGALWAVYLRYYKNLGVNEAIDEGIKKGLRSESLIETVRHVLE